MGKVGFMQDILRGVKKVLDAGKVTGTSSATTTGVAAPGVESLMKRGHLFLEDKDWQQASEYFNKVLDIDPEYTPAYVGKLCAELHVRQEEQLAENEKPFTENNAYQKAIRFATAEYREKLEQYNKAIKERIAEEEKRKQECISKEKRQEQQRIFELSIVRKRIAKYQGLVAVGFSSDGYYFHGKGDYVVAVKNNGRVITAGLEKEVNLPDTSEWRNIVAVAAGVSSTVGLKSDGTVVATGSAYYTTEDWRDIVAVAAGRGFKYIVGLKSNGRVITTNSPVDRYMEYSKPWKTDSWNNIVAVATGDEHTVGLKTDGTVVAEGRYSEGQCDVTNWQDIVAVAAGVAGNTVVLKSDGMVFSDGEMSALSSGIGPFDVDAASATDREEQQKREEVERHERWIQQGLCKYCGGKIGFISGKCKSCGKTQE
jgi:hypothetical protein